MRILRHLGRRSVLLGILGLAWLVADPDGPLEIDAFPPEFVLITISVFLLVMDLIKRKTKGRIHIAFTGVRTLGKWSLAGLFFNVITVLLGHLANSWSVSGITSPVRSVFLPVFELLGLHGSKIFFLLVFVGVVAAVRDTLRLVGWSLVKNDGNYLVGTSYKRQVVSALVLAGMAVGGFGLGFSNSPIAQSFFLYPVIPFAAGSLAHLGAVLVRVFGSHPWRETASEVLWGLGLAVVAGFVLAWVGVIYNALINQMLLADSQSASERYVIMISNMGFWAGVFLTVDTVIRAFSVHMFNIRNGWFLKIVATEPLIFQRLYRNGGKMFFLTYVLVHNEGPVSMMIDINFGAIAYFAYLMIAAVMTARVIELLTDSRKGLLLSGAITWIGIGLFTAVTLANITALVEIFGAIPNLANFADSALPYADSISDASWWLIAGVAIFGFGKTARSLDIVSVRQGVPTLMAAAGFIVVGWAGWAVADAFSSFGPSSRLAGAIVLGITFGGSLSLLAAFLVDGTPWVVSSLAGWASASRFRAMNIGGIAAAYLLVLRSVMFHVLAYAPLIEWVAVALISLYVTRRIGTLGKEHGEPGNSEVPPPDWVSHDQSVDFVDDDVLSRLIGEHRDFVERDQRTNLIARFSTVMWESGRSYEDIVKVVSHMLASRTSEISYVTRLGRRVLFSQPADQSLDYQESREDTLRSIGEVLKSSPDRSVAHSFPAGGALQELISKGEKFFVETSDPSQLLATYCVATWNEGTDRQSIAKMIEPLAQYDRPSPPWYHIGPLKRRRDETAREIRNRTVQDLRHGVALGGTS